jgi:hypothetical protein
MTRVLTCLGMVSVLLLTCFLTNVYAAEDFPTSDLGLSPSVVGASGEFNGVEITLSGFPGQTGESVTDVDLTPSPCSTESDITCTGFSDIAIPGVGVGHLIVVFHNHKATATHPSYLQGVILLFISAALIFIPSVFTSTGATLFSPDGVQVGITGFSDFGTAQYTLKPYNQTL